MSSKIILSIIVLTTSCFFFGCGEKPISTIIKISSDDLSEIIPKEFILKHDSERNKGRIFINDTSKLKYRTNMMFMKSNNEEDIYIDYQKTDTIHERILRLFKEKEVATNKYIVSFKMIDLRSKDIPTIFGNPRNNKLQYTILDMYTNEKYPLSKNEKDALFKSIFNDSISKSE